LKRTEKGKRFILPKERLKKHGVVNLSTSSTRERIFLVFTTKTFRVEERKRNFSPVLGGKFKYAVVMQKRIPSICAKIEVRKERKTSLLNQSRTGEGGVIPLSGFHGPREKKMFACVRRETLFRTVREKRDSKK